MKIRGTCQNCGRDFLSQQVVASGGHCWHCGKPYQPHYTAVFVEAIQQVEIAGSALEAGLEKLAGMEAAVDGGDHVADDVGAHGYDFSAGSGLGRVRRVSGCGLD